MLLVVILILLSSIILGHKMLFLLDENGEDAFISKFQDNGEKKKLVRKKYKYLNSRGI